VHDVAEVAHHHREVALAEPLVAVVVEVARVADHADLDAAVPRALDRVDERPVGEPHDGEVDADLRLIDEGHELRGEVRLEQVVGPRAGIVEQHVEAATARALEILLGRAGVAGEQRPEREGDQHQTARHQNASAAWRWASHTACTSANEADGSFHWSTCHLTPSSS
jgi:hypothetical protein